MTTVYGIRQQIWLYFFNLQMRSNWLLSLIIRKIIDIYIYDNAYCDLRFTCSVSKTRIFETSSIVCVSINIECTCTARRHILHKQGHMLYHIKYLLHLIINNNGTLCLYLMSQMKCHISRRQIGIPLCGRCRQVSLYLYTSEEENLIIVKGSWVIIAVPLFNGTTAGNGFSIKLISGSE